MRLNSKQTVLVVLEKLTTAYGDYNEPIESWNPDTDTFPDGEVYMEKWDQGGRETTDGQTVAYSDVRFKCRYIEGLNASEYRLNVDGEIFDIENIKEIGRNEGQILITESQDNQ